MPRACKNPDCGNTITGNLKRLFCSIRCKDAVNHHYDADRARAVLKRRLERNVQTAPPCSICGKSTARAGSYKPPSDRVPDGIQLCSTHLKGLHGFTSVNNYDRFNKDEVFTMFLVAKTFTGTNRVEYLRMMRDVYHATN